MNALNNKKDVSEKIFNSVITAKANSSITSSKLCADLKIDEEVLSDYFLGHSKHNMALGINILNYLEEETNKNGNAKQKIK